MRVLLGADVGTSAVKVIAADEAGHVLASASGDYPLYQPSAGWAEQEPQDWWLATARALRELLLSPALSGAQVVALGFSGQMHGSVLLGVDARGSGGQAMPLRRALLWNDQRTLEQCRQIETAAVGRRRLVELVGNAALTGFTLPKLMWVREHEPQVWSQVRHVLLPKDFVRFRLTGRLATDVGDASGTLVFDINSRRWSQPAATFSGIDQGLFPELLESSEVAGRVTPWAARETGLPEGLPVVAGSGDNMAGAVGGGVVQEGLVLATLGTSGVIFAHSDRPRKDIHDQHDSGRLHTMCSATGTREDRRGWCVTGCMLSAGGALKWCRDTIAPGTRFDQLLAEATAVPPGCEGLVFLPYLTGERCPYPDPLARATWVGLTGRHTRAHMVRAVVEGVTFGMSQILALMRGIGVRVESVRLSGGGNRSALWRQMQADVYGCPVVSTHSEEAGSALGAAILAGVGVGVWPTVADACRAIIGIRETTEPKSTGAYAGARAVYERLYHDLRPRFAELARS
jgi:xylulokinase